MKKKILSIVMIITLLAFSGCRNAEREASSTKTSESISYSHEFDTDSNSHQDLVDISYQIPLSWECSNADSGYYYYPENGMLYVSTDTSPFQVTESDKQNNFIDGFSSSIDEFQEIDRYITDIAGIDALVFEFSGIISQKHVTGKSYVFTYNDLLYCFIYSDFIAEQEDTTINSPTISMSEFNSLSDGMSYEEASTLIGGSGTILSESGTPGDEYYTVIYSWNGEGSIGANADVTFQGDKLVNKAQYGLE